MTKNTIRSNDNVTFSYEPSTCWTLASATCGPDPAFAIFIKKQSGAKPLALKAYIGGHEVEISNDNVKINGAAVTVANEQEYAHMVNGVEILKAFRWGDSVLVYSFLKVGMVFDGYSAAIIPAPSTKGQHCGICGNYNRNKYDEFTGKNMERLANAQELVSNWQWQC